MTVVDEQSENTSCWYSAGSNPFRPTASSRLRDRGLIFFKFDQRGVAPGPPRESSAGQLLILARIRPAYYNASPLFRKTCRRSSATTIKNKLNTVRSRRHAGVHPANSVAWVRGKNAVAGERCDRPTRPSCSHVSLRSRTACGRCWKRTFADCFVCKSHLFSSFIV